MNNIYSNPTPLRQKFIEYLTLNRKAERTVHCYVSFIYALAKHCRRSPDLLGPEDIRQWLYYLIAERKQAASTVNLAINAVRSFYGGLLQRDIEPLLHQIKRPRRPALVPRLYSMAEVEKLLTVGTEGNLRARAFLSCVYGVAACACPNPPISRLRTWTASAIGCWSPIPRAAGNATPCSATTC